jgi:hypothetical protein
MRYFITISFQFCFKIRHKKVKGNLVGFKLVGTHQLPVYADDVNVLGYDIKTIKINTETLIDARNEARIEVNIEETNYAVLSPESGQNMT